MKRFTALVLVVSFLNFVIAPDFAYAADSQFGNGVDASPSGSQFAGSVLLLVGAIIVVGGLIYLATKASGPKDNDLEDQEPVEPDQRIEGLQPKAENEAGTAGMARLGESPVTPSGELVLLKW